MSIRDDEAYERQRALEDAQVTTGESLEQISTLLAGIDSRLEKSNHLLMLLVKTQILLVGATVGSSPRDILDGVERLENHIQGESKT